jgi:hypothetical protein
MNITTGWKISAIGGILGKLFFSAFILVLGVKVQAQCPTFISPGLFGLSQTSIYCKSQNIQIGVYNSTSTQTYTFSLYRNGVLAKKKGGPLTGNGSTLSVAAVMRSAQDAGEYRIVSSDACGHADSTSYYAFYGAIDNLSITSWGGSAVAFKWAASGPAPAVTYEYAVSTQSDPTLLSSTSTTADTTASASGLVNGTTYYIHVRVSSVIWNGNDVGDNLFCTSDGTWPWQTIRFVACSAAAATGTITPVNAVVCSSSTVALTAISGFTSYQWYNESNTSIGGATSNVYNAASTGQYKIYVTKSGSTCQGMIATATVTPSSTQTSHFFGAGDFYAGDTVKLGIDSTVSGQTYKIFKDGMEVTSIPGIGYHEAFQGPADTIWYKFVITSAAQAGLYTVQVTSPYCSPANFGNVQVNFIAGVMICPNGSTSFTFSSPGNNTNFQWQVQTTLNGTFSNVTNAGVYSGATTKTLIITSAPLTMYGYNYRCVATGGTPVTSGPRTLKFGETWVGGASGNTTSWTTASNWSCNLVPTTSLDVIIPAGANQPVINSNVTCHSVLVKPGATLKVNSGFKLTITGQ